MVAVAISTTGEPHRIGFLETCVRGWLDALDNTDLIFVTVDGSGEERDRVGTALAPLLGNGSNVWQVGQPVERLGSPERVGVAANKNTGLELMMDETREYDLFLCDDDTWPRFPESLTKHTELSQFLPHSMVCWGGHRLHSVRKGYAAWRWPRGVLLYATRSAIEEVGGMHEGFGVGGHEHAEWSRRIFNRGLTPVMFPTPVLYAERGTAGPATRAGAIWHCEDMKREGETSVELGHRRKVITSLPREARDQKRSNDLWEHLADSAAYVPYRSHQNRRASATLVPTSTSRGAGGNL